MAKELGLKSKRGAGGAALVANPPRPPREYEVVHDGERVTMKLGTRHEIERAVLPPEQWSRVEESRSGPVVSHRNVRQALQGMAYKLGEFASRGNIADHWIGLSEVQKTLSNMIVETAAAPDSADTAARVAQLNALVEGTRRGNQQCRLELAALRTFTIELYVRGTSQFLQYFRTVPLAPNEQPNYLTSYMQETSVRYIAEDGYTTARMIAKAQKVAQFAMRALHTDDVLYPIRDLTLGTDVQESAKATVDLGFDMANQVDLLAYGLVTGSLGSFTAGVAGGAAALAATYIPNSRIQQALLPQTNILPTITGVVSPAANTPGWFQIPAAIIAYCDAWGNIFRDRVAFVGDGVFDHQVSDGLLVGVVGDASAEDHLVTLGGDEAEVHQLLDLVQDDATVGVAARHRAEHEAPTEWHTVAVGRNHDRIGDEFVGVGPGAVVGAGGGQGGRAAGPRVGGVDREITDSGGNKRTRSGVARIVGVGMRTQDLVDDDLVSGVVAADVADEAERTVRVDDPRVVDRGIRRRTLVFGELVVVAFEELEVLRERVGLVDQEFGVGGPAVGGASHGIAEFGLGQNRESLVVVPRLVDDRHFIPRHALPLEQFTGEHGVLRAAGVGELHGGVECVRVADGEHRRVRREDQVSVNRAANVADLVEQWLGTEGAGASAAGRGERQRHGVTVAQRVETGLVLRAKHVRARRFGRGDQAHHLRVLLVDVHLLGQQVEHRHLQVAACGEEFDLVLGEREAVTLPTDAHRVGRDFGDRQAADEFLVAEGTGTAGRTDDLEVDGIGTTRGEVGLLSEDRANTAGTAVGVHLGGEEFEGVVLAGAPFEVLAVQFAFDLGVIAGHIGDVLGGDLICVLGSHKSGILLVVVVWI